MDRFVTNLEEERFSFLEAGPTSLSQLMAWSVSRSALYPLKSFLLPLILKVGSK